MQIKTSLKFYLTPLRITNINKTVNNECRNRCVKLIQCWQYTKLVQQLWKPRRMILKMFKVISYKAKLFHSLAYVQRTHHPTQKILVQSCSSLLYLPKLYNGKKLMSGKLKCSTILSRVTIPVVKHHKQKQPREERICTVYHQRSYSRNLENDADEDTMKKCCLLTCF